MIIDFIGHIKFNKPAMNQKLPPELSNESSQVQMNSQFATLFKY